MNILIVIVWLLGFIGSMYLLHELVERPDFCITIFVASMWFILIPLVALLILIDEGHEWLTEKTEVAHKNSNSSGASFDDFLEEENIKEEVDIRVQLRMVKEELDRLVLEVGELNERIRK